MIRWTYEHTPFLDEPHRSLGLRLEGLQDAIIEIDHKLHDLPMKDACSQMVRQLGDCGLLTYAVPENGDADLSVRAICLVREMLGFCSTLADTMFAMQGIGTAALWQSGSNALQERYLAAARRGDAIAAFALTEPDSGSDVAATKTRAIQDGDEFVIDGVKAWISNGGIAHHYIVVARTEPVEGAKGLTAFIIEADVAGLQPGPMLEMIAPHPLSDIHFKNVRVSKDAIIGDRGAGFKVAMATFDVFRASVGAAALGMARRAMAETLDRVNNRQLFGRPMSQIDGVQSSIGDMATQIESASMMVYRSAWVFDRKIEKPAKASSMAKYHATEMAQKVIDAAVQLFGAAGVSRDCIIEKLYRDIRPTRIYEGASEVQKIIIARNILAAGRS